MNLESQRRHRPVSRVRVGARRLQLEQLEDRTLLSSSLPLSPTNWTSLGPAPKVGPGALAVSGRVDGIATDPTNPDIIYVATASGGVWKTTNSGVTWNALTDNQSTLFMGAIALAPSNSNVIYAGTGDANLGPSKLAFNRDNIYYGEGVLKSTDAGATWTLETGNNVFDRRTISKVVVDPTDPKTVYVAVGAVATNGLPGNTGIWKSTDGGLNWTDTTAAISTTAAYLDLVIDPANPQVLYAGVGAPAGDPSNGVYKTTNGGASWAVAGDLPTGATDPRIGRITLALAPSNLDILYVALIASGQDGEPGLYAQSSLYKMETTQDAGVTWTNISGNLPDIPTWSIAVANYGSSTANDVYYVGTDEGVYASSNQGTTWTHLGLGLPNVQVQNLAISAKLGILAAGTFGRGLWELAIPAAVTPPTVTNLQRFGVHLEPTTIVLTFSEPMDANRAGTLANYTLVATSHGRDRVIRLLVANYDDVGADRHTCPEPVAQPAVQHASPGPTWWQAGLLSASVSSVVEEPFAA